MLSAAAKSVAVRSAACGWTDADVRPQLRSRLCGIAASEPGAVVLDELGLSRKSARVDLALVNGSLHGYEIKSERDDLRRLSRQATHYAAVLERATLVTAGTHLDVAISIVPSWWEVVTATLVDGCLVLQQVRSGGANPSPSPEALASLLWRDEVLRLLDRRGCSAGVRSKARRFLWARLCETHTLAEIAGAVRAHLKARPARRAPPLSS